MAATSISKESFKFLNDLKQNNNRDWFAVEKKRYDEQHQLMISFADELLAMMQKHDNIATETGKKSLHRIYRDTRFSKDKTPYKNNFSGSFARASKLLRGGYYFHIEPGNVFVGGGFWGPEPADLKRVREDIAADDTELRKIINSANFKKYFGELKGTQLKSAPKGFDKEHPAIDLLRYKQFVIGYNFSDKDAHSADFASKVNEVFKAMRPFFNYMSDVLTTDINGQVIVD
jgi:uncharacterized protein (TIGR02453 family)